MARATVTIRELKNKDTGIDLSVTSFKETKGRLASTYEYQVMVVTNLTYFKTAKHKEADNVQFTFLRKLSDFEEIYTKFNTKYSGTAFPQLPKKVLMMNNVIAKERRNNFDHFVKYLASVPKFCTDSILLEFLGVSALKAGKLMKMEVSESIVNKQDKDTQDGEAELSDTGNKDDDDDDNLFDDDDITVDDDDTDLFTAEGSPSDSKGDLKMFDESDLSGALEEGEDDDLFIAGSRSEVISGSRSEVVSTTGEDFEEGTDDLFSADDDLDKIMNMKINTEADRPDVTDDGMIEPELDEGEPETKAHEVQSKPLNEIVPKPKARPRIPKRRDQTLSNQTKTDISTNELDSATTDIKVDISKDKVKPPLMNKPIIASKPDLKPKPRIKPKPVPASRKPNVINSAEKSKDTEATSAVENITEDDIMKYIQDNTEDSADLDLFS